MISFLKKILKNHFYYYFIRNRFSPEVSISQRQIFHYYQDKASKNEKVNFEDTGYRVFSQFEEDGKLIFIFAVIGTVSNTFIEIGSNDGINSNCANLAFHFGWHGLFVDGNYENINRGKKFYRKHPHPWNYQPKFVCSKVIRENINHIINNAGFSGKIDLLSIDIDGNDYWIWDALEIVQPNVVVIETHVEFGMNNIVVPYDKDYSFPGKHPVYHGASPVAMVKLAKRKGYRLVGANQLGFNFFFVKKGLCEDLLPEVTVESVLKHPSVSESYNRFEEIKNWEYTSG